MRGISSDRTDVARESTQDEDEGAWPGKRVAVRRQDREPGKGATVGAAPGLPYGAELAQAFGQDFSDVEVRLGDAQGSGRGAYARREGGRDVVAFDQTSPAKEQVAHELAHVTQQRRFGEGAPGLADMQSPSEIEARAVAPLAAAGQQVEVSAAPAASVQRDDTVAQRIHDKLHGWITDDERGALADLQGDRDRRGTVSAYNRLFGYQLWTDFIDNASGDILHRALALLQPYMTLLQRLETHLSWWDDDEGGILQTIQNATDAEVRSYATQLQPYLDQLSATDQYTARCRIWPERHVENVAWLLTAGDGWVWDDEGPVASAIMRLTAAERVRLWRDYPHSFGMFNDHDREQIRRMCVTDSGEMASDTDAARVRMELATDGLGTDEDGVTAAVGYAGTRRDERAQIEHALATGMDIPPPGTGDTGGIGGTHVVRADAPATPGVPLTDARRRELEDRLRQIGDINHLLTPTTTTSGSELDPDSFLGRVQGDMDDGTVDAAMTAAHADEFDRARQALLATWSWTGDVDEDAVLRILRGIQGSLELGAGETAASLGEAEVSRRRAASRRSIIQRLQADLDLALHVFSALDDSEWGIVHSIEAGDTLQYTLRLLTDAYEGIDTDEAAILRIIREASAADRERMRVPTAPDPIGRIRTWATNGNYAAFSRAFEQTLQTGTTPTYDALDEALGDGFDGTNIDLVNDTLTNLTPEERARLRRGYLLHERALDHTDTLHPTTPTDSDRQALAAYTALHVRLRGELSDEELDDALTRMLDIPTVAEMSGEDGAGRRDAAELMLRRQRERLRLGAGLTELVTTTDDTAEAAHVEYEAHYNQAIADGNVDADEFAILVRLDTEFQDRFRDFSDTANLVPQIASSVAAVVAACVVIAFTDGVAAPGVLAWLSANSGLISSAAAASAITQVATAEAFGGDFHETLGAEGAREALSGAVNGALAVCGASLAEHVAELAGLSGPSLTAAIARAATQSVEVSVAGRAFARGALMGLIDGSLGGAIGDLTMTLTDAQTWRHSVWGVLARAGESLLHGAITGGLTGAATGGLLEMAGGLIRARGMRDVEVTMDLPESQIRIEGPPEALHLRFGPNTTDADIAAHVDRIVAIRNTNRLLSRAREIITGIPELPIGTVAGNARHEAAKIPQMLEARLASLRNAASEAEAEMIEAEIALLRSNLEHFSGIARAGDPTEAALVIARMDAPDGYPTPPLGHHYRPSGDGSSWVLQRNPVHDPNAPRVEAMAVVPIDPVPATGPRYRVVPRSEVEGGPVEEAVMRSAADGGLAYDALPRPEAAAAMDAAATRRLEEAAARDVAAGEVARLRTSLGLTEADTSSSNIDATIARLRAERGHDPQALEMIEELARQRAALTDARREMTQASELLGNTAAMEVMDARGATHLWGNPTPPGRPGQFDFIYVLRDGEDNVTQIFVVEAKGAGSTLGTADFGGLREQGSRSYLSGIAERMRPRDDSELDQVLAAIATRSEGGPEVRYVLVQAPVDDAGTALAPRVREFDVR